MSLSLPARRARLLAVRDLIDAGGGGALQVHQGPMPAGPELAAPEVPLSILALPVPCAVLHATDAALLLGPVLGNAAAFGLPTWARYVDGNGLPVYDCTAGPPGSGAELIFTDGKPQPSALVYTGGEITVSHTFTEPA